MEGVGEMKQLQELKQAYAGKCVLVTGHTGFKGSWLSIWLKRLGASVVGYGLDPYTEEDNFVVSKLENKMVDIRGDIRDKEKLQKVFEMYKPEVVFHLAAQALVRQSYIEPIATYETNVMGTINVLECVRNSPSVKVAIMVTTDKCYENKDQLGGYKEEDALGGYDPYSSSKAAAEIAIQSFRRSFFNPANYEVHGKAIASVRAGNVIGGGDWAKDRIIPDCIRALQKYEDIHIRSPKAIRPWQHVLEPLSGYLLLGKKMLQEPTEYSESWNFGPALESVVPVREVAKLVVKYYGKGRVINDVIEDMPHEAGLLNLDRSKALFRLGWTPTWPVEEAVFYTVKWYQDFRRKDPYKLCLEQIEEFEE